MPKYDSVNNKSATHLRTEDNRTGSLSPVGVQFVSCSLPYFVLGVPQFSYAFVFHQCSLKILGQTTEGGNQCHWVVQGIKK